MGLIVVAALAPVLAPVSFSEVHPEFLKLPPFSSKSRGLLFLLGTDDLGRDLMSRLIYGTRLSLGLGALIAGVCLLVGGGVGLSAGYLGGKTDQLTVGGVDILMSFPGLLLAILIVATLGHGLLNTALAIACINLPPLIRLTRASVLEEKNKAYIETLRATGASPFRILLKHILPGCLSPMTVQILFIFSEGVLGMAGLGFLGLGVQPPLPEWGTMISDSRHLMTQAWWLLVFPGLCLFSTVLALSLVGNFLRDQWDPRFIQKV